MDTGFRKRSCPTSNAERDDDSKISHPALGPCRLWKTSGSGTLARRHHDLAAEAVREEARMFCEDLVGGEIVMPPRDRAAA